jgi:hypothetical protein
MLACAATVCEPSRAIDARQRWISAAGVDAAGSFVLRCAFKIAFQIRFMAAHLVSTPENAAHGTIGRCNSSP